MNELHQWKKDITGMEPQQNIINEKKNQEDEKMNLEQKEKGNNHV
jgi:hypothetical protein